MPSARIAVWSCIRPGRTAPHHRVRPWPSLMVVVLIVFCLRLPETKAARPGCSCDRPQKAEWDMAARA